MSLFRLPGRMAALLGLLILLLLMMALSLSIGAKPV